MRFHGDLNYEKFLIEWFGSVAGREFGTKKKPHRFFVENPNSIIPFVSDCQKEGLPAWMTVQPRREYDIPFGIEKIYFDFDAEDKENPDKEAVAREVKRFLPNIEPYVPLVVETYRGYHIYIFLRKVLEFRPEQIEDFATYTYEFLQKHFIMGTYDFLDWNIIGDIKRMSGIPLSYHEKGIQYAVLDNNLEKTKIRSVEYYRVHGIGPSIIKEAIQKANKKMLEDKKTREKMALIKNIGDNLPVEGTGKIRPCFLTKLDVGEMGHQQRLALLSEAYWGGNRTEEGLVDLFRTHMKADYKEKVTRYQVRWFLRKRAGMVPPYKCLTMINRGWCIEDECPIYRRRVKKQ